MQTEQKKQKVEQKPQLTAAQRIERLETAVITLDKAIYQVGRQVATLQDAVTLLNDKVSAMVVALSSGLAVNDDTLNRINLESKISEMKQKISTLVENGTIEKSEEVTNESFLVVREINSSTGEVINPRLQFAVRALPEEDRKKILGKKVGESVAFSSEKPDLVVEIEEIYSILNKNTTEKPE